MNIFRRTKLKILIIEVETSIRFSVFKYCTLRPVVPISEAKRFITDCMLAVDTPRYNADIVADALTLADYRGCSGHGMRSLEVLVKLITKKFIDPHAAPEIIGETKSGAIVNGRKGFGHVVSKFCMNLAVQKAKYNGVGVILARNSHYNRMLAYSTLQALQEGVITLCVSNTPACMSPEPLKGAILGSNPFSLGAPAEKDDYFLLDISSTEASLGKIEERKRKNMALPTGWAKDKLGRITTSPDDAIEAKMLLPIGGLVGVGLAIVVEILTSVLCGSKSMLNVSSEFQNIATVCHCFCCINPEFFASNFKTRMNEFLSFIRQMEPINPNEPVLIPGDPERSFMQDVDKIGGLVYTSNQLEVCKKLSFALKVPPLKPILKSI